MRRFTIDSSLLGTERHFVCSEDGFVWSDSVPRDSWHLTGKIKSSRCLDTLLKLERVNLPTPDARYLTAMKCLTSGSVDVAVPWQHALPQNEFRIFFENLVKVISSHFSDLSFDYYDGAWTAGTRVFAALKPAKIDEVAFDKFNNLTQQYSSLQSFSPNRSGFSRQIVYDRFSTKTGRLTVASGPDILTLKKEFRPVIKTSFDSGSIAYVDFRALEARIVLAECGKKSEVGDLYEDIAMTMFGGEVQRDVVKTAVISELYGISRSSLRAKLGVSDDKLDSFISVIRRHFALEELQRRLEEEVRSRSYVTNRFGRKLYVATGQDNTLVNTYAQSSGVDIALCGFDYIIQKLGTDGVRPLFVLHDAVILDVREDRVEDVKNCNYVPIPTYDFEFPVKIDFLNSVCL